MIAPVGWQSSVTGGRRNIGVIKRRSAFSATGRAESSAESAKLLYFHSPAKPDLSD
jgi:hypothetical protein